MNQSNLSNPCRHCQGTGKICDNDYMDMHGKEWKCLFCQGTGIQAPPPPQPTFTQRRKAMKKNVNQFRL